MHYKKAGGGFVTRAEKQNVVDDFASLYSQYSCMVVVRQVGINSAGVTLLRREARSCGVVFKIMKNNLAKRALNSQSNEVLNSFTGPTGVFLSKDPVALAKLVEAFSKKREEKFFPLGGVLDGRFLKSEEIKKLATLPSVDDLRRQLLGLINSSAIRLLSTIKEPSCQVARVLGAYCKKL